MKILLDLSPATRHVAGIGTYAKELVAHLLKIDRSNEYRFFAVKSPFPGRGSDFRFPSASNVSLRFIAFPYNLLNIAWNKFRILPVEWFAGDFDLVHSFDRLAPFTRRARKIITIHDMAWYIYAAPKRKRHVYNQVADAVRRADAVITVSEFSKGEILHYMPFLKGRLHVAREGVSERFRVIDEGSFPEEVRKKYPWDGYILYMGSLEEPRKNVESLISAYADLKKRKRVEEKLLLCGRVSGYSRDLLKFLRKVNMPDDIIVYPEWIPDGEIPYIYNKSKFVILPSLYEGFGLTVLEAMACGRPVIASDIPPLKETAKDAALFFDPKDITGLSKTIEKLSSDKVLHKEMVEKGLARAKECGWLKTASETLAIYEKYGK